MTSGQNDQTCRLCGGPGPLCRSHIVPELIYEPLKNAKRQLYQVGRKVKKIQVGHRERLLCAKCEHVIERYERHFKQVWMDTIPRDLAHLKSKPIVVNVSDFSAFKLFHLSVFWRGFVSVRFKIEDHLSLGPHESEIARMLLDGDPGRLGSFPIIASLSIDDRNRPVGVVAPLAQGVGTFEGHPYYMMSYAYCDWILLLANPGPLWLAELDGKFRVSNSFLLEVTPFEQSKGALLWTDIFRKIRTDWRR